MNDDRFDALARTLSGGASRRAALRGLIAATLGGAAGLPARLALGETAARCRAVGRACGKGNKCCGGATCRGRTCRCRAGWVACGRRCTNPLNDPLNCGGCGSVCASGRCLHGTCTCDPFDNRCPTEVDGQCGCAAVATAVGFQAACVDRNSACDLDKPCDTNADCPPRSVCLRGCSDPPDPRPNRCSTPCNPV